VREAFRACDFGNEGVLSWSEVKELLEMVRKTLPGACMQPDWGEVYKLYARFDGGNAACLELEQCLRLAEVALRGCTPSLVSRLPRSSQATNFNVATAATVHMPRDAAANWSTVNQTTVILPVPNVGDEAAGAAGYSQRSGMPSGYPAAEWWSKNPTERSSHEMLSTVHVLPAPVT